MFKKINKKGFTLAELLIVVAIIGVLVAVSIPIFTAQLEKAREATDAANIRSAYAEMMADSLTNETATGTKEVKSKQTAAGWASNPEFPDNLHVDDWATGKTKWTLSYETDAKGLVTGIKATIG